MKIILPFKFLSAVLLAMLLTGACFAQKYDGSKSVNKSSAVPANVTVVLKNHSGDLKISTTAANTVLLNTKIEITGDSKTEVDKVLAAIGNMKFELHGNILDIDTRFYKSINTINSRSTITLLNGDKINIKNFRISHELQMPKSAGIELDNKYSDIEIQSVDGNAKFLIYSSKMHTGSFAKDVVIESKYSKIWAGNIEGHAKFDFYDCDIEMESCRNLDIKSKYSKFILKKAGILTVDSYDDRFNITGLTSLNLISKYSDFETSSGVKDLILDLYDSNVNVKSAESVVFKGKYCDLFLGDISMGLKSEESYDNNFYMGKVRNIEIGASKYSLYEIGSVSNIAMNDIYDDNIKISNLNTDFSSLSFNGKYGKIEIDAGTVPFRVDFNIKYPKVIIPENLKISKQIKDDSNLELVAGEAGGTIKARGYDMKLVIE